MTPKIVVGFDCCRDYDHPTRPPRIYPRKITMNMGDSINLYLRVVHPDCYDSCYTWKILTGGGFLEPEVGIQTYYHAPSKNEMCKMNPVIEARCPRGRLDKIYIAVAGLPGTEVAFYSAGLWKEGFMVVDGKVVEWTNTDPRYVGTKPTYGAITIRARYCDGSTHYSHKMALVQMYRPLPGGKYGLWPNRWRVARVTGVGLGMMQEAGPTYDAAKNWLIDSQINPLATKKLKKGYTWKEWMPTWDQILLHPPIHPGETLDVRSLGQLEKSCCHHDLILEE